MYALIHISGGTEVLAWTFDHLEDLQAFRERFADDEQDDGSYKNVEDIPVFPGGDDLYGERDDHETDTWLFVEGAISAVDGLPVPHIHRVGDDFVEQPILSG